MSSSPGDMELVHRSVVFHGEMDGGVEAVAAEMEIGSNLAVLKAVKEYLEKKGHRFQDDLLANPDLNVPMEKSQGIQWG